MAIDAQIYTKASNTAAITGLVSTRFYPEKDLSGSPQLPFVTFSLVSTVEAYHTFSTPTNFDRDDQYRFDIWALTHDSARSIAKQIIKAFHGFNDGTICCLFDSETEIAEDDEHVYHHRLDFLIHSANDNA